MTLNLITRRTIRATPARLFEAWTQPEQIRLWWGPVGVRCTRAEVEPGTGGRYRIDNLLPDGTTLSIVGTFVEWQPPSRLRYTWTICSPETSDHPPSSAPEQVTVRFKACGEHTEVIVVHERIADEAERHRHREGWEGCFAGLCAWLTHAGPF